MLKYCLLRTKQSYYYLDKRNQLFQVGHTQQTAYFFKSRVKSSEEFTIYNLHWFKGARIRCICRKSDFFCWIFAFQIFLLQIPFEILHISHDAYERIVILM